MKTKLFITGLFLMAATAIVDAQEGNGQAAGKCRGNGTAYVDKNNNGVCDNSENQQASTATKRGKGTGKCDGTGQGKGKNRNFVDANKNGICDNYEARTKK